MKIKPKHCSNAWLLPRLQNRVRRGHRLLFGAYVITWMVHLQYKWHVSQDHEVTNIQSCIIYPKKWLAMLSEREGGGMKKLKGIFGEGSSQVRCSLWLSQFLSLFGQKGYLGDGNRQVLVISSYNHINRATLGMATDRCLWSTAQRAQGE